MISAIAKFSAGIFAQAAIRARNGTRNDGSGGETVMAMLDAEINRQAAMVAYIDDFRLMMIAAVLSLPLILMLRRPGKPAGDEQPLVIE